MTLQGEIQNHLGVAYLYRAQGDRADNIEQALKYLQSALAACAQEENPAQWALIQNNLGLAFDFRIQGDHAENKEAAISAFQSALTIYSRDFLPDKWAMTQNNLGVVYLKRMRDNHGENLQLAIRAHRAALEVYTKKDFPMDWAMSQANLGVAYEEACQKNLAGSQSENLAYAFTAYQAALNVYTKESFPEQWAGIQANLANLYTSLPHDLQGNFSEKAIQAVEAALSVYDEKSYPEQRTKAYINLGHAYFFRTQGLKTENLEQAARAFQTALEQSQTIGLPDTVLQTAAALGSLYYFQGRFPEASAVLETACNVLERFRFTNFTQGTKLLLAEQNQSLYEIMVDTCLRLKKPSRALELAEASKTRVLLEQLGYGTFPVPSISVDQQPLLDQEVQVVSEARALSQVLQIGSNESYRANQVLQLEKARNTLESIWNQLQTYAPNYVALRRGDPITYEQAQFTIAHLGCKAVILDLYTLPTKTLAFILRSDSEGVIPLEIPVTELNSRYELDNYQREIPGYGLRGDIGQRWQVLANTILEKALSYIDDVELIYIVPHGFLHRLPLHASLLEQCYLIDRAPIVYVPSLAVLKRVTERMAIQPIARMRGNSLVLGYTSHEDERLWFEGEADWVAKQLNTTSYVGNDATIAQLRNAMEPYDILHVSCHGFFNAEDPMASGLMLADGVLTARDIMSMEIKADLVTLSACQTGVNAPLAGDELVGLTRAFLYAGASTVLVSLWSVNAQTTLDWMNYFYNQLATKKTTKAVALQQTMLHIRTQHPHPYFWAPFVMVGNWR